MRLVKGEGTMEKTRRPARKKMIPLGFFSHVCLSYCDVYVDAAYYLLKENEGNEFVSINGLLSRSVLRMATINTHPKDAKEEVDQAKKMLEEGACDHVFQILGEGNEAMIRVNPAAINDEQLQGCIDNGYARLNYEKRLGELRTSPLRAHLERSFAK